MGKRGGQTRWGVGRGKGEFPLSDELHCTKENRRCDKSIACLMFTSPNHYDYYLPPFAAVFPPAAFTYRATPSSLSGRSASHTESTHTITHTDPPPSSAPPPNTHARAPRTHPCRSRQSIPIRALINQ